MVCIYLISTPSSSNNVAKLCLKVCGVTRFLIPAFLAISFIILRTLWEERPDARGLTNSGRLQCNPYPLLTSTYSEIAFKIVFWQICIILSLFPFPYTLTTPSIKSISASFKEHNSETRKPAPKRSSTIAILLTASAYFLLPLFFAFFLVHIRMIVSFLFRITKGRWEG